MSGTASEAVAQGQCPKVRYDGHARVVKVHACGHTREVYAIMRVWTCLSRTVDLDPPLDERYSFKPG